MFGKALLPGYMGRFHIAFLDVLLSPIVSARSLGLGRRIFVRRGQGSFEMESCILVLFRLSFPYHMVIRRGT